MKKTYIFNGTDGRGIAEYHTKGSSFEEIFKQLYEKEVISGDDVDSFVYKESGTSADDYWVGDDDYDQERYDADYALAFSTDADYYRCITQSNGNAYFQNWKIYDDKTEYEVDDDGELFDKADLWSVDDYNSNIVLFHDGERVLSLNHDECIDYTYDINLEDLYSNIDFEITRYEEKAIENLVCRWLQEHSKNEYSVTDEELEKIIENHQHYVKQDCEGWEDMKADLSYTNLQGAKLEGVNLSGADMAWANLSKANLREAYLSYTNLHGVDLSEADLTQVCMLGADLSDADLTYACMSGADLRFVDLRGADLRMSNLSNANLSGDDLRCAELRNANLKGANLKGANLRGANLTHANLDEEETENEKDKGMEL